MPRKRMTDTWLRGHKPKTREEWSDDLVPGLVVRFGERSPPVFYVRYRDGPRVVRTKLGTYGKRSAETGKREGMSLEQAREQALEILGARRRGEPPPVKGSFAELAAAFIANREAAKEPGLREVRRILKKDVLPVIGHRQATAIRPRAVAEILDALVARGAPVQANRVRAHLMRIFRFGIERDYCESNPAQVLSAPHKERPRERRLNADEIAAVWHQLALEHQTWRHLFRLLLLTAMRPGEARLLTWSEVEADFLRIPAEKVKPRRELALPLTPATREVLDAQRAVGLPGPHVFPSPKPRKVPTMHADSVSHFARRLSSTLGFDFHAQDLRRTVATGMAELGVDRFIRKLILNHADPDVHGVYDRYRYHAEMRSALELWSAHVLSLVQSRLPATQA